MLRPLALLLAAACADPPSSEAPPAAPAPAAPDGLAEARILAEGPPEGSTPYASALSKVAAELGVGVVRCPLEGGGKVNARYGTPRDQALRVGPLLLLEVDPKTEPPWDLLFDTVVAEDDWLSILAVPGATTSWVASKKRVVEFEHPAAGPGETVTCTSVREAPFRTVRGKVDLAGATGRAFPFPCVTEPPPVGADGTFVLDVPVPCTLWVEVANRQSNRVFVAAEDEILDASFVLGPPDELQGPDRRFTEEGRAVALAHLASLTERHEGTLALVERVAAASGEDEAATKVTDQWKYDLWAWKTRIDHARNALEGKIKTITPEGGKH